MALRLPTYDWSDWCLLSEWMFGSIGFIWDVETQQALRHLAVRPVIMVWGFSSGWRATRCGQESSRSLSCWNSCSNPWVSLDFLSMTYVLQVLWKWLLLSLRTTTVKRYKWSAPKLYWLTMKCSVSDHLISSFYYYYIFQSIYLFQCRPVYPWPLCKVLGSPWNFK